MTDVCIRDAQRDDLEEINQIIAASVNTWDLPERVKRLTLPSHQYQEIDFEYFRILVAGQNGRIIGVAALDNEPHEVQSMECLLLHGLYVNPECQYKGIGSQLFHEVEKIVNDRGLEGLLVKAQKDAAGFFVAQGMERLPVENEERDYVNRYFKPVRSHD